MLALRTFEYYVFICVRLCLNYWCFFACNWSRDLCTTAWDWKANMCKRLQNDTSVVGNSWNPCGKLKWMCSQQNQTAYETNKTRWTLKHKRNVEYHYFPWDHFHTSHFFVITHRWCFCKRNFLVISSQCLHFWGWQFSIYPHLSNQSNLQIKRRKKKRECENDAEPFEWRSITSNPPPISFLLLLLLVIWDWITALSRRWRKKWIYQT